MSSFGSLENIISGKYELIESLPAEGLAVFNGFNKYCVKMFERTSIHKRMTKSINISEKHNTENVLLAGLIAKELGVSFKTLKPVELKKKGKIIDATYSANVHGVLSHLDYLDTYSGKKILIMPCLIELGSSSSAIHRKIGERIDRVCDLAIITTKDRFKEIKGKSDKIIYMHDPKKIFDKIKAFSYDILLLESRVPSKLKSWLLNK